VRIGFALPLIALALWAEHRGFAGATNSVLRERADLARAGGGDLSGLQYAYPPLPTLLAVLAPGTLGVAIFTALCAGVAMQLVTARLVRREVPLLLLGMLVLGLIAVPALWFEATQNLSGFLALMFLVIALDGFVRFVARNDTIGGFVAGLMLAAAFLCDPIALVYAVALAVAAPLLATSQLRHQPGGVRATLCVLLFPLVAVGTAWAFLEWRFTGGAFATLRIEAEWFSFDDGVLQGLADATRSVSRVALRSPVYLVIGALLLRRRTAVGLAYAVPFLGLVLAAWTGFALSDALEFALLNLIALYSVPRSLSRDERIALAAAAVLQFVLLLSWDPAGAEFHRWAQLLF
jgi:hypothetical protein